MEAFSLFAVGQSGGSIASQWKPVVLTHPTSWHANWYSRGTIPASTPFIVARHGSGSNTDSIVQFSVLSNGVTLPYFYPTGNRNYTFALKISNTNVDLIAQGSTSTSETIFQSAINEAKAFSAIYPV